MSTFVIGDIHGGLKGLKQLLAKVPFQSEDLLIFLGDYVDGWNESAQVIDYLIDLEKEQNCLFIRGNHDVWCQEWLEDKNIPPIRFKHGAQSTIESYKNYTKVQKEEHLRFINQMKMYHIDKENRLFIHAGFTSMYGPEKEVHLPNYNWDRTLWEMAICMDKKVEKHSHLYPKRLKIFKEIFIGHTPTQYYKQETPMNAINVWNIDTGAAFKGKISMMNIDTKEFWQSDTLQSLYPNENGRN